MPQRLICNLVYLRLINDNCVLSGNLNQREDLAREFKLVLMSLVIMIFMMSFIMLMIFNLSFHVLMFFIVSFFLLFMVPLPGAIVDALTMPMKLAVMADSATCQLPLKMALQLKYQRRK